MTRAGLVLAEMEKVVKRIRTSWRAIACLAALAAAVVWFVHAHRASQADRTGARTDQVAVPVQVALAEKKDFPIYIYGLGTVQAFNSVTVRARVDGQIESIAIDEGQTVASGQPIARLDPAPFQAVLDQAIAKLAQDEANLKNAKQDLLRTQTLGKNGYATQQLLDQRVAAEAQLTAQVQADNAAIEAARVQLAYATIVAPISGVAGIRLIDVGNIVHAADQSGIITINQVQPISAVFTAPESVLPQIRAALSAGPIEVTAFASDGKTQLAVGELKLIDNQIDVASGTIRLKATFANAERKLWPGQSISTRVKTGTLKEVVVVPDAAVQRGPSGMYAYVAGPDDKAVLRTVRIGQISEGAAVVEEGLSPGERVVTAGQYRLQPGAPLAVRRALAKT